MNSREKTLRASIKELDGLTKKELLRELRMTNNSIKTYQDEIKEIKINMGELEQIKTVIEQKLRKNYDK